VALRSILAKHRHPCALWPACHRSDDSCHRIHFEQVILLIFGGISILANLRPRLIDHGLKPLSVGVMISRSASRQSLAAYVTMLAFSLGVFR
jgi:hypothetical protein